MGRATPGCCRCGAAHTISIHALREESDKFEGDDHGIDAKISIHALREESDLRQDLGRDTGHLISIHALREESDLNGHHDGVARL